MNKSLVQSGGNRCYKVTKGSEFLRVLCNIQRGLYKIIRPTEITTSWKIHWHVPSLSLLINIHARVKIIDLCQEPISVELFIAVLKPGIGIVIHYKHNLIHSYIQSLNPILKILKFKYLQIRHKHRNQLATKAQSFPRKSSNTVSPMQLATPEISHEIEGAVQIPHP